MPDEPFDFLFPNPRPFPVQVRVSLPVPLLRDIRSALEMALENHEELIAITSRADNQGFSPSQRREVDHQSAGAARTQYLLDQLAQECPDLFCEAAHA